MRTKIPLSAIVLALLPKSAQRGLALFVLLIFSPLLLVLIFVAVSELFERLPILWTVVVLVALYRLGKRLFNHS